MTLAGVKKEIRDLKKGYAPGAAKITQKGHFLYFPFSLTSFKGKKEDK